MNKRRLQAFTILEVTIAMLLAALTIGIAYTAYTVVSRSYKTYDQKNHHIARFVQLDRLLKKDISEASRMIRRPEGVDLESGQGTITYRFSPGYILRNQYDLQTDTFYVATSNLTISFEDREAEEDKVADRITMNAELEGAAIPLVFTKQYSAEELFE